MLLQIGGDPRSTTRQVNWEHLNSELDVDKYLGRNQVSDVLALMSFRGCFLRQDGDRKEEKKGQFLFHEVSAVNTYKTG